MLIYTKHDPRFFDQRLYKGGDGGAGQMRADEEDRQRKVQLAVDAINQKFGVGPQAVADIGAEPTRAQFTKPAAMRQVWRDIGDSGEWRSEADPNGPSTFDEVGYNSALADYNTRKNATTAQSAEVIANKTAREAMYTDIADAVKSTAMRDLDRQYSQASQRNTFGLARSGLLGGSVDAESGGELATLYGEGKLKASEAGRQAGSDLRVSDEKTRQNLISLAQSGLDTGTAASLAASQMGAAADLARSQAAGANVGRLFDDLTQAYVTNQVNRARYPNGLPQQQSSPYSYGGFGQNRYFGNAQ